MKESTQLIIYGLMLTVPISFIIYTLLRVRRHWNDGHERVKNVQTTTLIIKYGLTFIIGLLSAIQAISLFINTIDNQNNVKIMKIVFFGLFSLGAIMSIIMLRLEASLGLIMKWFGHRIYWPGCLMVYAVIFVLETGIHEEEFFDFLSNPDLIMSAIGVLLCMLLTVLALFKPNEFDKRKDEISANLLKKTRFSSVGHRKSVPEDRGLAGTVIVSIKDYKIKVEGGKQVVFYNISVKIKGQVEKVRRTYYEFDKLYKAIRKSYPVEIFQYMSFPQFPIFSGMGLTLEQKTEALNDFIAELCCPEFMLEDTLDFLNIQGPFRDKLLEEHDDIVEAEKAVTVTEADEVHHAANNSFVGGNKISIFEKSSKMHSNLCIYFQVKLNILGTPSNKTQYEISWIAPSTTESAEVQKKYKDFASLNSSLKRVLSPSILPKFPEKSYVQNLRKADSQAIEIRRRKLEKYMCHILNDPGFFCLELFEFIDCKIDINSLLERVCNVEYELCGPVGWEGELDGASSYIIYLMSFAKFYNQEKTAEWSVKRTFKDFEYMNNFLLKRLKSPQFIKYMQIHKHKVTDWPRLPNKHPESLSNPNDIEICRSEIESYMDELCMVPGICSAYAFKGFIDDPDNHF